MASLSWERSFHDVFAVQKLTEVMTSCSQNLNKINTLLRLMAHFTGIVFGPGFQ